MVLHWFPGNSSVNGQTYLEMLEEVVAPLVEEGMWFQQDGAPPYMPARAWLQEMFEERVISRLTPLAWPSKSPDLSCLDYWFWGVAMAEVRRNPPNTLVELKNIVEGFAESLEEEEVTKAARGIMKRARACRAVGGAAFEYKLDKILKSLATNEE